MKPVYAEDASSGDARVDVASGPRIVAGIDVHKRMLVVVAAASHQSEEEYEARKFGTTRQEIAALAAWLQHRGVQEVAMESTAQYWKPVWQGLEAHFQLHLAQARSTTNPRGRKSDARDARRIVARLLAHDLTLSYVPEVRQRMWRMLSRTRAQMSRQLVRLRGQMECILEDAQIKLSSVISDLWGVSGRRILTALVEGESDPAKLASLGHERLHAGEEQLREALEGQIWPQHRTLLKMQMQQVELLERQSGDLEKALAEELRPYQDALSRLCRIPGMNPCAAQQVIAEIGVEAEAFPSPGQLSSWVGVCPGQNESAGVSSSHRSPKGNRLMRSILTQIAWAAVRTKDSYFSGLFQRWIISIGKQKAIWAVAHRILCLIWKLLHHKVEYRELGPLALHPQRQARRKRRLVSELRRLGYQVQLTPLSPPSPDPAPAGTAG